MSDFVLGYLINNLLIDSQQYEAWRKLESDQLKEELSKAGIMSSAEYEQISQQLEAGSQLPQTQEAEQGITSNDFS